MRSELVKKLKMASLVSLVTIGVGACVNGAQPPAQPAIDAFCVTEKPWRPTDAEIDRMSDDEVSRKLAHNIYGQRKCGWKP